MKFGRKSDIATQLALPLVALPPSGFRKHVRRKIPVNELSHGALAGEKLLLAAMIQQAMSDLMEDSKRLKKDAKQWIASTARGLNSFEYCCYWLGWDSDECRQNIRAWLERKRYEV